MKYEYKPCASFDNVVTFEELISYNNTCKINTLSDRHFETYDGIMIYVSHPNVEDKFTIQLGVDETGIQYEGDGGCLDTYKEIPILEGLKILEQYRILRMVKNDLEYTLCCNEVENNSVFINIK